MDKVTQYQYSKTNAPQDTQENKMFLYAIFIQIRWC